MKSRRVIVTLEIETDETLPVLRDKKTWSRIDGLVASLMVHQVHVNVVRQDRRPKQVNNINNNQPN